MTWRDTQVTLQTREQAGGYFASLLPLVFLGNKCLFLKSAQIYIYTYKSNCTLLELLLLQQDHDLWLQHALHQQGSLLVKWFTWRRPACSHRRNKTELCCKLRAEGHLSSTILAMTHLLPADGTLHGAALNFFPRVGAWQRSTKRSAQG